MSSHVRKDTGELPLPVGEVLRQDVDALALERTWRRISASRQPAPVRRKVTGKAIAAAALTLFVSSTVLAGAWVSTFESPEDAAAALFRLVLNRDQSDERRAANPPPVPPAIEVAAPPAAPSPGPPAEPPPELPAAGAQPPRERMRVAAVQVKPAGDHAHAEEAPLPAQWVPTPENWRSLASRGDHAGAYRQLTPGGMLAEVQAATSVEALFTLADLARLANEPRGALPALEKIVTEHPEHPGAALAAFTAGKVRLQLGDAEGAARDFGAALAMDLPAALQAEARQRQAEALRRAKRGVSH